MFSSQDVITIIFLICMLIIVPVGLVVSLRNQAKKRKFDVSFAKIASKLGLVQSGITNNDDYEFFFDAFTLSKDSPIWQTSDEPKIFLNPYRKHSAELIVKGNYALPAIKLESKNNKTHIQRWWGSSTTMSKIQLEGNFNRFFTLYCEPGQEIIALQIINPDIMQNMIDNQSYYDVHIQGAGILIATDVKEWTLDFTKDFLNHAFSLDKLLQTTQKVTDPRIG